MTSFLFLEAKLRDHICNSPYTQTKEITMTNDWQKSLHVPLGLHKNDYMRTVCRYLKLYRRSTGLRVEDQRTEHVL